MMHGQTKIKLFSCRCSDPQNFEAVPRILEDLHRAVQADTV